MPKKKETFVDIMTRQFKTRRAWAEAMQYTESALSKKIKGETHSFSCEDAIWIEKNSKGKVKRADVRPDLYG